MPVGFEPDTITCDGLDDLLVWPTAPNDPPVEAQSDTSDETPDVADGENYAENLIPT
jgi:hypothetical protein